MNFKSVKEILTAIKNKDVSVIELTSNYLDKIKERDDELNCFVTLTEEFALNKARKIDEEIDELKKAKVTQKKEDISEEIGDLFFTLVNLSRHYNLEPEDIIRKANLKFEKRFRKMEDEANKTKVNLEDLEINELETLWQKIK